MYMLNSFQDSIGTHPVVYSGCRRCCRGPGRCSKSRNNSRCKWWRPDQYLKGRRAEERGMRLLKPSRFSSLKPSAGHTFEFQSPRRPDFACTGAISFCSRPGLSSWHCVGVDCTCSVTFLFSSIHHLQLALNPLFGISQILTIYMRYVPMTSSRGRYDYTISMVKPSPWFAVSFSAIDLHTVFIWDVCLSFKVLCINFKPLGLLVFCDLCFFFIFNLHASLSIWSP